MTKTMTIRLREPRAGDLELVAKLLDVSQAEVVRRALDSYTPTHLGDPALRARLAARQQDDLARIDGDLP